MSKYLVEWVSLNERGQRDYSKLNEATVAYNNLRGSAGMVEVRMTDYFTKQVLQHYKATPTHLVFDPSRL